jgi:protease I
MNAEVIKIVQHFAREKRPIAAVCHAAQLLAAADVIRGKRVSAYPAHAAWLAQFLTVLGTRITL